MKRLFVALIVWSGATQAHALSGLDLYHDCQAASRTEAALGCIAYIHGLIDGMQIGRSHARDYCPPKDGLSVDQGIVIIEKYFKSHSEGLNDEAGLLAGPALLDAYPCKKSN
jgi:Rap1a immunity proteins